MNTISRISTRPSSKRCNQCWKVKPRADFIGKSGKEREKNCNACTAKYKRWPSLTAAQKLATRPKREDSAPLGRVRFVSRSLNRKLGPIPVTYSERGTCPPACMFYEAGCYAEVGKDGAHWRGVREDGLTWDAFLEAVRALPEGTLWRHNEAGDLAGTGNAIDPMALADLAIANRGRRGFTFTHKPVLALDNLDNALNIRDAIEEGFTINLSADSLEEADAKADLGIAPVVVTVAEGASPRYTPGGRKVVVCPAQTNAMTCADCQLCANLRRKSIIAFRAHGQSAALVLVPELIRRKRVATQSIEAP